MDNRLKEIIADMFSHDYFNFLSLITVLYRKRAVGRLVVSVEQAEEMAPLIEKEGLYTSVVPRRELGDAFEFEGGKNRWICIGNELEHYKIHNQYLFISSQKSLLAEIEKHEKNSNFEEVGKLYGFPDCCAKTYCQQDEKSLSDSSLITKAFLSSKKKEYPYQMNYGSYNKSLLLHFPCSYDCKKSLAIAKEFEWAVACAGEHYHDQLSLALKGEVYYTSSRVIFICKEVSNKKVIKSEHCHVLGDSFTELEVQDNKVIIEGEEEQKKSCVFN